MSTRNKVHHLIGGRRAWNAAETTDRMICGLALPLLLTMLLAPACAAAAAAEPSFDCRTGKTARELATCGDLKLAAADRELAVAWHEAIARLDPATAKALREDQRKFLADMDAGFDAELWGKQDPPEGKELRAQIAQLRRGGDYDALAALEAEMRERIAFLRHLTPTASVVGLWKNHNSEILVTAADDGRYRAIYGTTNFGWAKYHCHFTAAFAPASGAADKRLAAHAPHNTDPEVDDDSASTLFMARDGALLTLAEETSDHVGDAQLSRICPRHGEFDEPLFHTGLRAEDARRLKPDE
jgi:uncharacterized protein YecT (DUF1311 family)